MYFFYRIITAVGMMFLAPYYALRGWRRGEPASALWERLGNVPPEMAPRAAGSRAADGPAARRDLDSRRVGWRSPRREAARGGFAAALSRARDFRLDDHRNRSAPRARTIAVRGWHFLFSARLGGAGPACPAIHPARAGDRDGDRNLAEFPARSAAPGRARDFANARISEKSFARFKRWEFLVGEFFNCTLQDAELFLAQTPEDAARLREMGAAEERVEVIGNLKYDAEPPAASEFGAWLRRSDSRAGALAGICCRKRGR